jgi:hypothetical protein
MGRELLVSEHALERMQLREVSEEAVRLAVRRPDWTSPAAFGATNYWKEIDGRTIRVTVGPTLTDPNARVVWTVSIKS